MGFAVRRTGDAESGAFVTTMAGFLICGAVALGEHWQGRLWPFFLIGLLAPGGSQLLFLLAVRDAGPSRTSVVVGAAPLVSVTIALVFLGEPLRFELALGAVLVVLGGLAVAIEGVRPERFKWTGVAFALLATVLFATRDAMVRWLATSSTVPPALGAACSLLTSVLLVLVYLFVVRGRLALPDIRRSLVPFAPAAILWGSSYVALFEAFYHARVSVVSPLVATEALFAVVLSAFFLRHSELIGRYVVAGALLVVAGGALIGAFR
jgi:drug/metabolite transporter (DMT)-like permease